MVDPAALRADLRRIVAEESRRAVPFGRARALIPDLSPAHLEEISRTLLPALNEGRLKADLVGSPL